MKVHKTRLFPKLKTSKFIYFWKINNIYTTCRLFDQHPRTPNESTGRLGWNGVPKIYLPPNEETRGSLDKEDRKTLWVGS